ncbi:MAG: LLM class flavin-dependent oxidoreductase [Xanthobacteraceae bacterium]
MHLLDHKGRFYSVEGPLNIDRCAHGHSLIIQAGGSPPGQELSARTADIVFSVVNGDKGSAKTAYDDLKRRTTKYGRAPDDIAISAWFRNASVMTSLAILSMAQFPISQSRLSAVAPFQRRFSKWRVARK